MTSRADKDVRKDAAVASATELDKLKQRYTELCVRLGDMVYQCEAVKAEMRAINLQASQADKSAEPAEDA